jgi:hypothetical protein
MRDDMANVVTERPRRGHGNKSRKTTGLPIRRYDPEIREQRVARPSRSVESGPLSIPTNSTTTAKRHRR